MKGLELISICCGLFNPSRALGPYLLDFLHLHTKLTPDDCKNEKIAQVPYLALLSFVSFFLQLTHECAVLCGRSKTRQDLSRLAAAGVGRLDRLRAAGARHFAPSQVEFAAIRVPFHTADGGARTTELS